MSNELPIRWILKEIQTEEGISPKKRMVLQMRLLLVKDSLSLTPPEPEAAWVDVPMVREEDLYGSNPAG